MFERFREKKEEKIPEDNDMSLIGFKDLEEVEVDFGHFHESYKLNDWMIAGKHGACWKIYSPDGWMYPVDYAHSIELGSFGKLICKLGARETEYDTHELIEMYEGQKRLVENTVRRMLKEAGIVV